MYSLALICKTIEIEDNLRQFMVSDDWLEGKRGVQEMEERVFNQENKKQAWELLKQLEQVYEAVRYVDTCLHGW